jgi:hypothetical protein
LNSTPPPLSFTAPFPGTVSTSFIFAFTYMCTHFLHCIHPPTSFPATSPTSHWYYLLPPPQKVVSCWLTLNPYSPGLPEISYICPQNSL